MSTIPKAALNADGSDVPTKKKTQRQAARKKSLEN